MSGIEREIAHHYTHGSLDAAISAALNVTTHGSAAAIIEQLAAVDEFHIGGRDATARLAEQLDLEPGMSVLDVGCGIGGTARLLASRFGCRVTGVDLTEEYIQVGNNLNRRVGLDDKIELRLASATDLRFADATFDRATLLHVGMNVPDKRQMCAEIARVIKPGGRVGIYDVMRTGSDAVLYPVPWAQTAAMSFVDAPDEYRRALHTAGFEITAERDRRQLALDFFGAMKRRTAEAGAPPLGLHILMGLNAAAKVANMIANLENGCIAPVEMIARRL